MSIQSGQDVFLIDVCREKSFIDYISCNDSVMQVNKLRDKLYEVNLFSCYILATFCVLLVSWKLFRSNTLVPSIVFFLGGGGP